MLPTVHAPRFRYRGPGEPDKLNLFRNQLLYDMTRLDVHAHAQGGVIDEAYEAYRHGQGVVPVRRPLPFEGAGGEADLVPVVELRRRLGHSSAVAFALASHLH